MEPWLDSLSDDWNPQQPSSPPSLPQSHAPSSVAPHSRASRIPRYISPQKPAQVKRTQHSIKDSSSLRESEEDNINTQPHSSLPVNPKPMQEFPTVKSGTTISAQSVIKHGHAEQSQETQQAKDDPSPQTPDWKQLALRKQDLFSSFGLENIFQKPESNPESSSPNKTAFSFENELSIHPSSPPTLTPDTQLLTSGLNNLNRPVSSSNLEPLQEQEEEHLEDPQSSRQNASELNQNPNKIGPSVTSDTSIDANQMPMNETSPGKNVDVTCLGNVVPASSSSVTDGFSPVFISKHNTVDGRVDYAAFDPSGLPKLSKHVNVDRGGYSDTGSFKKRPLSSSMSSSALPSDSLAPSDSVSQVRNPSTQDLVSHKPEPNNTEKTSSTLTNNQYQGQSGEGTVQHHSGQGSLHEPQERCQPSPADVKSAQTVIERHDNVDPDRLTQKDPQANADQPEQQDSGLGLSRSGESDHLPEQNGPHCSAVTENLPFHGCDPHTPRPQSVAGKKRKDARYDSDESPTDASTISQREILRPRNPTPWQGQRERHRRPSVSDGIGSPSSECDGCSTLPENARSPYQPKETAKVRALASEAATFRIRNTTTRFPGDRKKSVSTQDYLNEAMRIMDLIRTRKKDATSDWSSNTGLESDPWDITGSYADYLTQTVSRPPSREGPRTAWRSQTSKQIDPKVESQLRRYEETGDESFLVSSIVRSVKITEESRHQHEQNGVRITDNPHREGLRRNSDPENPPTFDQEENLHRTRSSNGDTDDSGRTQKTSSTQKMSSIGRIAPETVSHLIQGEEAGMRFDTQKQTWVKCKALRPTSSSEGIAASSATTDDDPLAQIPDLSVNEQSEIPQQEIQEENIASGKAANPTDKDDNKPSPEQNEINQAQPEDALALPSSNPDVPMEHVSELSAIEAVRKQGPPLGSANGAEKDATTKKSHISKGLHVESVEQANERLADTAAAPASASRDQRKKREQSVFFSSPPVSRAWEPKHWTPSSDPNRTTRDEEISLDELDSSQLVRWQGQPAGHTSPRRRGPPHWSRNVSMAHTDQHQEISFVEHRPDGRTFSLSMSVSTPIHHRRHNTARPAQPSALIHSSFMHSLSPLSDFSVSNDDGQHMQAHALARPAETVRHGNAGGTRTALTTTNLVGRLTDAEPDEPYWDFMHRLSLAGKDLDTIHMLDDFCPRLEELDVSNNSLRHVNGAPASLRHFDLSHNQLTSLTDLSRLNNLQYLNISNNGLVSLESFSSLVHLRELNVNDNEITSIEGILDLDGLLSISLKNNKLRSVDFSTAQLTRLASLDLCGNQIDCIEGLSALSELSILDMSSNKVNIWPPETCANRHLRTLNLANNKLSALDISGFPALHTLCANTNALPSIAGVEHHTNINTVFLNNQTISASAQAFSLDQFTNLTSLSVAGTPLPPLLPLTTALVNLRNLDISFTGTQCLPGDFGMLCPNLQSLNLNSNSVKDLRPLEGVVALRHLYVARNRIARLRKFVKALGTLGRLVKGGGMLETVDVRDNPLSVGFYYKAGELKSPEQDAKMGKEGPLNLLVDRDKAMDAKHLERVDEETRMKRRIYEMLVGSKCPKLKTLDGLVFDRARIQSRDTTWERLVEIGVVQRVMT